MPAERPLTARQAGLMQCHDCRKLVRHKPLDGRHQARCPRCGAVLHMRMPGSLSRPWSFVITAAILFFPANLLPIMTIQQFGSGEADTILSGVIQLLQAGLYPLALIVFVASILVPSLKIVGLVILLLSIQFRWRMNARQRTILYRWIELVGRWSMLDIFVMTILVALVNLGRIATVEANAGATAFAAVVVMTMFAATSFDARLLWDDPLDDSEPTA